MIEIFPADMDILELDEIEEIKNYEKKKKMVLLN
jgi:hypothetical protein